MTVEYGSREIGQKYDEASRQYARMETVQEALGIRRLRSKLLRRASGEVLEVACGTGTNFPHYPDGCRITAVDLSRGMLEIARERADELRLDVDLGIMDAEALDFPDRRFDTVVSSLTLCTFPDPIAALREMGRICRQDGRILLLEHGRSSWEWLGRFQDRNAHSHARHLGCHWNREPLDLLRQAGLRTVTAERTFFGVFHRIEAKPPAEDTTSKQRDERCDDVACGHSRASVDALIRK